jgi:hypothetical protein
MPTSNAGGIASLWTRLPKSTGLAGGGAFFAAMFDAARDWMDNLQATVPGYRDRIVHISLDRREGGLNLNMPTDVVKALTGYGQEAGQRLTDRFVFGMDEGEPTAMTWENHRWVRYRSTMAVLERFLADFSYSVANPQPGDSKLTELVLRGPDDPPGSYRLRSEEQRDYAEELTEELTALGARTASGMMQDGAARPAPELRVRPKF